MTTFLAQVLIYAILLLFTSSAILYFYGSKNIKNNLLKLAFWLASAGGVLTLIALIIRTIVLKRLPLTSGFDFLLWFISATVFMYLFFEIKSGVNKAGGAVMLIVAFLTLTIIILMPGQLLSVTPMMAALKSPWLSVHVFTAVIAYSSFALATGLAIISLFKVGNIDYDYYIYRIVALGFTMLSFCIITGAIWAEQAWGTYWSWDPKEIWSLITWIIYAVYLHLHRKPDWKGRNSSIVVIIGFLLVLFTFFGVNYLMSGLHSYGLNYIVNKALV